MCSAVNRTPARRRRSRLEPTSLETWKSRTTLALLSARRGSGVLAPPPLERFERVSGRRWQEYVRCGDAFYTFFVPQDYICFATLAPIATPYKYLRFVVVTGRSFVLPRKGWGKGTQRGREKGYGCPFPRLTFVLFFQGGPPRLSVVGGFRRERMIRRWRPSPLRRRQVLRARFPRFNCRVGVGCRCRCRHEMGFSP